MSRNIVARITNTGILYANNYFDEITESSSKFSLTAIYSTEFDEVNYINVAQKILSTGKVQVQNYFDEVSGITLLF